MQHLASSQRDTQSALLVQLADQLRALADCAARAGGPASPESSMTLCDGRCAAVRRYRAELRAAVAVLEQTRTSFKSKELGALRRRLVDVLEATAMEPGAAVQS